MRFLNKFVIQRNSKFVIHFFKKSPEEMDAAGGWRHLDEKLSGLEMKKGQKHDR